MATKKFDRCLKNLLTVSGVTCENLARHLGVPVPEVRRWMNGIAAPDIYQFQEIARFFGLPCEWFLDDRDGFPDVEELADQLGFNVDTLEGLLLLAATENEDVLEPLDDAIYAIVSSFLTILGRTECGDSYAAE